MGLAELQLPRNVAYVGLARAVLASGARLAGLPEERLEDLKIAVSEAATQAMLGARDRGPVLFAFGVRNGAFEVHALGALTEPAHDAETSRDHDCALGLRLMEGLADEIRFPDQSRTRLVLRFLLAAAEDDATAAHAAAIDPAERGRIRS